MNCEYGEKLILHFYGEAGDGLASEVEAHLKGCASCRDALAALTVASDGEGNTDLAALAAAEALLSKETPLPSEAVLQAVMRQARAAAHKPLFVWSWAETALAGAMAAAFLLVFLALRALLPEGGWMVLAAVNGSWVGGTANLIAVKQAIGMPDTALSQALLMDTVCYSLWVATLFSAAPLAAAFNRWSGAPALPVPKAQAIGTIVLWLGIGLAVSLGAAELAGLLPTTRVLSATSWKLLIATAAGLIVAQSPLTRVPGSYPLASGLLYVLVAVMASQSSFFGLLTVPLFVLAGLLVLALHAALMALAARTFHFDLALCSVSSLANIGGVASAPLLAAYYSPLLVPVGVLLAMLGYVLGTGTGLMMASLLSRLAPG